jgi:tetratricopeptide (TPR) repeat protein
MNEEFITEVEKATDLVRKKDRRQLGDSALTTQLAKLLQKQISGPLGSCSAVLIGDIMIGIFSQAIEEICPDNIDEDSQERRIYVYLKEFVQLGKERQMVEDSLSVSRSLFFEIQQKAIEVLATKLWYMKEAAELEKKIKHNLERSSYTEFIERYDDQGRNYIKDIIIPELRDGRSWTVALVGDPGCGKSALSHAVAEELIKKSDGYKLNFDAVIWISCRRDEYQMGTGRIVTIEKSASLDNILERIASTLKNREVFQQAVGEKKIIIDRLLKDNKSLIVLDNFDSEWIEDSFKKEIESFVQDLPEPHKVLVTMRKDQYWKGMCEIPLHAMNRTEAYNFLYAEAISRRLNPFTNSEFEIVYAKTYGMPLVMKQVLGLTRVHGYQLKDALDFDQKENRDMLMYMYGKAFERLPIYAQKILLVMPFFADAVSGETLEYTSGVSGPERMEAISRLYRSHMIESIKFNSYRENTYTLLPFMSEYLRGLRIIPNMKVGDELLQEFTDQALSRSVDYYIKLLETSKGKDSQLLVLKNEKENIKNIMKWCWEEQDIRFVNIMELIGIPLGTIRYLQLREDWGQKAVQLCLDSGKLQEANWYQIRDVAWSTYRQGTSAKRERGLQLLNDALDTARKAGWFKNQSLALTNLAKLDIDQGNYDQAEIYLEECLRLWKKTGDSFWYNITLLAQARLLQAKKKPTEAIEIYNKLLKEFVEDEYINGQIETLSELAVAHALTGDGKKAFSYLDIAEGYASSINPPAYSLAYTLERSFTINLMCGNIKKAKSDLKRSIQIYRDLGASYWVDELGGRLLDLENEKKEES